MKTANEQDQRVLNKLAELIKTFGTAFKVGADCLQDEDVLGKSQEFLKDFNYGKEDIFDSAVYLNQVALSNDRMGEPDENEEHRLGCFESGVATGER